MAVLVCCVSVGSRKVRLGKFGQGGLGGVRHHLSWFGGLGRAGQRGASPDWVGIGMARLGGSGKEGYGKLRRGVAWRLRRGMLWSLRHGESS